jgi:dihydrofolate reductase
MRIRSHFGVSLDGFAATPDGMPVFNAMPDFAPGQSYGMREFLAGCAAVVAGRVTFDAGHAYWSDEGDWAWEGYPVYVLTSQPLPANVHADVIASEGGAAGLVAQLRAADLAGDVHVVGGVRTLRAFHELGAIDRLEIVTLPILLGAGVPPFPLGPGRQRLRLESQRAFPDGALEQVYTRA